MTEYQDAKKLVKALNEIKATPFQRKAAAILLQVNGLDSALAFVNNVSPHNEHVWDGGDNLRVCIRCHSYETTNPDGVCWHCKEQDMIDEAIP